MQLSAEKEAAREATRKESGSSRLRVQGGRSAPGLPIDEPQAQPDPELDPDPEPEPELVPEPEPEPEQVRFYTQDDGVRTNSDGFQY